MPPETDSSILPAEPARDQHAELVAFLENRSVPCPRCGYDLRNIQSPVCPECAEPLILKVGSPRARFGWLILAMAPGCFSGVASLFVLVPVFVTIYRQLPKGQGVPWPVMVADAFGFLSAASVIVMYRHRHEFMSWNVRRQGAFAASVWGIHVLMFGLVVFAIWYFGK